MQEREKLISRFTKLTSFNLEKLLVDAYLFFEVDYPLLVDYYQGKVDDIGGLPYKNLTYLEDQVQLYFKAIEQFKSYFKESSWHYLFEELELLDNSVKTCKNLHKWTRSSISFFGPKDTTQLTYQLSESETLERLSRNFLNSFDADNDWKDIAFSNSLVETDYSNEGGQKLKLPITDQVYQESLDEVVDSIVGTSCYGKDLSRKLEFVNDDLLTLSEQDTILQAVEILASLYKETNPEFPQDGLQKNFFIGSNRNLFAVPILTRQLAENFSTDKTLTNLLIQKANIVNDSFVLEFTIETSLGEQITQKAII